MWSLVPLWLALSGAVASLRCPDGQLCQGLEVCCRDPGGDGYACCPPPLGSPHSLPMTQASSVAEPAGTVCPDGTQCPAEYSCLRTPAGSFSCCPLSEAVACADRHHCCPRGSHCSADGRSCFLLPGLPAAGAVQCPDGESECPNESTCCMMPTGSWGCCPMPQAACCTDKVHCCPHATTCDLERARCLSATGEQPLGSKVPARKRAPWQGVPVSLGAITCPDHKSVCQDGTTCCQLPTSQYGCCPLQNAVCCSDHLHCCPKGTTCDLQHSKCASALGQMQPLTRLLDASERAREVRCDEQTSCPDGSTCCRRSTGAWACCPLVEAVCCQDHVHCCPKGYTCDPAGGSCQQALLSVPWAPKAPAHIIGTAQSRGVKCNQTVSCEDGQTCCKSGTGSWACCHLPNAVCCEDHQHCCPWGYTCNLATQSCEKHQAGRVLPVGLSLSASLLPASPEPSNDVTCDAQHYCHARQTCCKAAMGAWACCPYHWGSCCSDKRHCCPWGYRCSKSGLDCRRRWFLRWDAGAPQAHRLL